MQSCDDLCHVLSSTSQLLAYCGRQQRKAGVDIIQNTYRTVTGSCQLLSLDSLDSFGIACAVKIWRRWMRLGLRHWTATVVLVFGSRPISYVSRPALLLSLRCIYNLYKEKRDLNRTTIPISAVMKKGMAFHREGNYNENLPLCNLFSLCWGKGRPVQNVDANLSPSRSQPIPCCFRENSDFRKVSASCFVQASDIYVAHDRLELLRRRIARDTKIKRFLLRTF